MSDMDSQVIASRLKSLEATQDYMKSLLEQAIAKLGSIEARLTTVSERSPQAVAEEREWARVHAQRTPRDPASDTVLLQEGPVTKGAVIHALGQYADLVTVESRASGLRVTPRGYLGSENYGKVKDVVDGFGGEYVSAGKQSHFRIPTTKPTEATP